MTPRHTAALTALLVALLPQTACFTVEGVAPYGADVTLIPGDEPVEVSRRYQKWYAIWGVFDLTPTANARDVIKREELVEVRIYTEDAVEDVISGFFYTLLFPAGIILPQTVVVEGNRDRTDRSTY